MKRGADYYFHRDLSWLAFNERVLQEAENPSTPLLERLRFLAIYSSNLDEFFRVRVASIRGLLRLKPSRLKKLDFNPSDLLEEIHRVVDRQQRRFGHTFRTVLIPLLREHGVSLHVTGSLPPNCDYFLRAYFANNVAEHIHPIILDVGKEPPFLANGSLYLAVCLWPKDELDPVFAGNPRIGIVQVPSEHTGRFVQVAREPGMRHIMFVDDVIRYNLADIFPFHSVGEAYEIKVTRDAELYIEDEFSGNLVDTIRKSLKKRDTGIPTRLLFDQRLPYPVVLSIQRRFGLEYEDLVVGGYYHNFRDFFAFPDFGRAEMRHPAMSPLPHPSLDKASSVIRTVRERDRMLHLPYQSFDPVIRMLREASANDDVSRISITLYRVAPDSAVVRELITARERGKRVRAFVEVKARFDEQPNLEWAHQMEDAGVEVIYSLPGIKVHAKLLLLESSRGDVAYLSTGNFNEKTARIYSDHGLFTADTSITQDAAGLFELLQNPDSRPDFKTLLVGPQDLRTGFETLVQNEIDNAAAGRRASMLLKMNSLEDDNLIELLYLAGRSGVRVRLIVRGICRLIPGVPGMSENITATSIVDRFLEHARVYRFHADGDDVMLLSSADWMSRNLNRRVEVAWPVKDEVAKAEIDSILNLQMADSLKARHIDRDQSNAYVDRADGDQVRAQSAIYRFLAESGTDAPGS